MYPHMSRDRHMCMHVDMYFYVPGECMCMETCILMYMEAYMLGVYSVYVELCITSSQGHVSYHACQLPLYSPETMPAASRQVLTVSKLIFWFHIYRTPLLQATIFKEPRSHSYQEDGICRVGGSYTLTGKLPVAAGVGRQLNCNGWHTHTLCDLLADTLILCDLMADTLTPPV